jgi:glutaredoxin 2
MLEEELENKNIFIRKIEQYLQETSELSKVISSISVTISLDNIMIIIMLLYFIYLKHQIQDLIKRKKTEYLFSGLEQSLEVL